MYGFLTDRSSLHYNCMDYTDQRDHLSCDYFEPNNRGSLNKYQKAQISHFSSSETTHELDMLSIQMDIKIQILCAIRAQRHNYSFNTEELKLLSFGRCICFNRLAIILVSRSGEKKVVHTLMILQLRDTI